MQKSSLYPSSTPDGKCVFCEIVKGAIETPGIFWEDDDCMAFLSTRPNTEWFTVVIPKNHYGSDVLAMPDDILQQFILAAKKVSQILLSHFDDVGRVGVIMEGTGIDHAHIKLFPMHGTGHMKQGIRKQYPSDKNDYFDQYEWYIASNDGPKADPEILKRLAAKLAKISSSTWKWWASGEE